jgi:uncharacterized caspase-like protein
LVKCLKYHESETLIRVHQEKKCQLSDLRSRDKKLRRSSKERAERRRERKRTEEDFNSIPAYHYCETEINEILEVDFADGELERLGIVNVDPFDLNG